MSRSLLYRATGLAWLLSLTLACNSSRRIVTKDFAVQSSAVRGSVSVVLAQPAKSAGAGGNSSSAEQAGEPAPVDKAAVASNAGAGSGVSAGMGGASASDSCEEGKMRCSSLGGGRRERCQSGQWKSAIACASSDACSGGECRSVTDRCRGSAGQPVCDAAVLHLCNADGSESPPENCMSARQCQAGIALRGCAPCSPGDYRCTDTKLER